MAKCPQHTFTILTKRPQRAAAWPGFWTPNIQMGTSVEDCRSLHRLDDLRPCAAQTLLVSFEPLLEDLGPVDLAGYAWALVGSESGPNARPMDDEWVRSLLRQCLAQHIAFFFKQRLVQGRKDEQPLLDGVRWAQFPTRQTAKSGAVDHPAPPSLWAAEGPYEPIS